MIKKLIKNNIFLTIFIWIIVFWIIYIFSIYLVNIDKSLSDKLYSNFVSENLKVSDKIIVVKIDDESIEKIWKFPFSRSEYIPIIENLKDKWAAVVWMDIIFADKSNDEVDEEFAKSLEKVWNVIIWWWILNKKPNRIFQKPYQLFEKLVMGYWYFHPIYNINNDKVYSVNAYWNYNNWKYFHFWIQVLRWYLSKIYWKDYFDYFKKDDKYFYVNDKVKVPAKNWKEININFLSKNNPIAFKTFSFYKLANKEFYKKFSDNYFKDKIIIIWYTAKWLKDIFISPEWQEFWVYTHANLINTILTNQYKIYFNKNLEYFLIFILILLSVYINLTQRWKNLIISNLSIISIFTLIIWFVIDIQKTPLNFPTEFIFALIITLTISNILKSFIEDKNKSLLNKALSQYVSKNIAQEILSWDWKVKLDWEKKYISIFFSDIEWFTSISEKMNPEELVKFLREYLWEMSNIIMDNKWLIDKYEWDAIMALWWVFWYENSSTYDNCISAINQQKKLKLLNIEWKKRFWEELKIRMWLHTWEAIVWNIWATGRKMEYTALWDSVNLASRLEEVNKKYWTYLCVSEIVFKKQKDNFDFRYLDQIRVKWKNIPVKIYELISIKWELDNLKNDIINRFEEAIDLYLNKDFKKALNIFEELSILWDNPSKTYISRCKVFIKNPPEENWDWVWTMKTK